MSIGYEPPEGWDDALDDAANHPTPDIPGQYQPLEVDEVGTVMCRRPMPNAAAALAMAANSKIDDVGKVDHLGLFLRNHMQPGEEARVLVGMMRGEFPADAMHRVARAVSTWGTARPTRRSSR